ncbi:DNA-binding response regulator [Tetragenococcus osmophilus]|uniref:DNA-binding response regulator n=1 Tax=Tetragenococcus osmophilus TaxID=526944 RepID=A0AA37XHL1_9ENTE|nr:response regulator transcription factor [Tetragenococcus osmophilus]AYW47102.1 DNA-binding response regulator [Tetragenococcus osmophilus]GMA55177.1 DNA-binding response regulator [Alicyclobacillus contaminans]GMA71053.1 DNA-binding response regulator [Tetragenococcus osmophilus]
MQRILIIEDEKSIAELEQDYLEMNGFDSDIATTGEDGLQLINKHNYQLILLDLMLPNIDGFELCERLRQQVDIPILMVTARKEDIDKIRGFNRGADDYIVKPFNPSELVARVKAHISRYDRLTNKQSVSSVIQVKNMQIDVEARRIFIDEKEKILTAKEYDLLYFLAMNPNIGFSKDDLFEKIWGYDAMGDNTTVTVHIRKIREKIEKDPSQPQFIETIWGVGYRFQK